jgi:hypothetical protein
VVEAPAELLGHVADVGGEVGRLAVGPVDDPILVVAELGRAEPQRAVLLVEVPALAQASDPALDPATLVQRGLGRPDVEVDAEPLEAGLDAFPYLGRGPASDDGGGVGATRRRGRPDRARDGRGEVVDVVALVAVFRDGFAAPDRADRGTELIELAARVVEVVLARHPLPARLEHAAEEVADEGPARVADRQRAGRVGRHELDVDRARRDRLDATPRLRLGEDAVDDGLEGRRPEADVEEPGRRDLDRLDR